MRARARVLTGWAVVLLGIGLFVWWGPAAPAQSPSEAPADLALGGELYAAWCVTCHGNDGRGVAGPPVRAGPAIADVDVRYADLILRTGRMPLLEPQAGIISKPDFTAAERASLVAWMAEEFDLPGEVPEVAPGSAGAGAELYATHCAACHGIGGVGGVSGGGNTVRAVKGLDPVAVVEAVRVGPSAMPAFSESLVSDEEARDLAAFVTEMSQDTRSPLGVGELSRVAYGLFVLPLVVAATGVVMFASGAGRKRGR